MNPNSVSAVWSPRILSVLRIMVGLLFLEHGTSKLLGFPVTPAGGQVVLMGLSGILELVGGALVALGLFTRAAAFIVSGEMAVAYFMAHAPQGFFPLVNRGEAAVLFCFVFLYLAVAGAGPWSVDSLRQRQAQ